MVSSNSSRAPRRPPAAFSIDGQRYELTGSEAHETESGRACTLWLYRTRCAACGRPFELKVTRKRVEAHAVSRRCEAHRAPGVPVSRDRSGSPAGETPHAPIARPRREWRPEPIDPAAAEAFVRLAASYDPVRGIRRRDFGALLPDVPERQAARWWRRYVYRHLVLAPDGRWQPRRSTSGGPDRSPAAPDPVALDVPAGILAASAERQAALNRMLD